MPQQTHLARAVPICLALRPSPPGQCGLRWHAPPEPPEVFAPPGAVPLVVMTPKSMLRNKLSVSTLDDLTGGGPGRAGARRGPVLAAR